MNSDERLSPAAQLRMQAMLPDLLGAVRWRRRRRHAARAAVAVVGVALGLWLWRGGQAAGDAAAPGSLPPGDRPAPREICRVVRDVPDVLSRYRVATVERPEWFVDDDGLQRFLDFDQRPAGIVRVHGRVLVASAAVDPFPPPSSLE